MVKTRIGNRILGRFAFRPFRLEGLGTLEASGLTHVRETECPESDEYLDPKSMLNNSFFFIGIGPLFYLLLGV